MRRRRLRPWLLWLAREYGHSKTLLSAERDSAAAVLRDRREFWMWQRFMFVHRP